MGRCTAQEAAERAIGRAARPTMLTVTPDRALREASASDRRQRRLSPLDGMPVLWKDLFDIAGTVTTAGSVLLADNPPAVRDGALVRRLGDLGVVTVGKTNLSEFAFSGLGINRHFGTPVNPRDPTRVPGGSSSGSAVAVAAGMVPLAIGTDTSGSVRVPAAFTGCVGYRASHERYGRNDFHSLSPTLDCVGFLASGVGTIRVLDNLLAPQPPPAPVHRLIIPAGEWLDDCTAPVRDAFGSAVKELRHRGIEVRTQAVPALDEAQRLLDVHGTIVGAEAYVALGHLHGVEPATRRRLQRNADADVAPLRRSMPLLRHRLRAELGGAMLLCPTVRREPPRIADLDTDAAYDAANADALRTTMVLSYLGACGVSLPVPGAGILLSAPQGDDVSLLSTAEQAESVLKTTEAPGMISSAPAL